MDYINLSEDQLRNLINSEATFTALEAARRRASTLRGSMFWRAEAATEYLVRATPKSRQTRLGARSAETEEMFSRFVQRKAGYEARAPVLGQFLVLGKKPFRALCGKCQASSERPSQAAPCQHVGDGQVAGGSRRADSLAQAGQLSDLRLLRKVQGVVNFDAQIAHSAFQPMD